MEKYLDECLESVVSQNYKDFKVIIVDDGSTDNSKKIIKAYVEKYNYFTSYFKKNGGLSSARNYALKMVDTDFLTFIDSDDYLAKDYLSNLLKYSNYDLVISNYKIVSESSDIIKEPSIDNVSIDNTEYLKKRMIGNLGSKEDFFKNMVWNNLYRTSIIKKNNIYFKNERELPSEDLWFNLTYLNYCNNFIIDNKSYYYYRLNKNSITRKYDKKLFDKHFREYKYLRNDYLNFFEEHIGLRKEINLRSSMRFLGIIKKIFSEQKFNKKESHNQKLVYLKTILKNKNVKIMLNESLELPLSIKNRIFLRLLLNENVYLLLLLSYLKLY